MTTHPPGMSPAERVLLIGWDAAEWGMIRPLVSAGRLPHLARLIQTGQNGTLTGGHPLLSPTRWTSIVTGAHPTLHGILGAVEIGSAGRRYQPIGRAACKSPPIWSILDRAGIPCHCLNFPATHPPERLGGVSVSNRFFEGTDDRNAVLPTNHLQTLRSLRLTPGQVDAETLRGFVPRLTEADRRSDPRIEQLAAILAHSVSVHAATTWAIQCIPWRFAAVCYTGLHQFSHAFMRYASPRMQAVSQEEFDKFAEVIPAAYQFHDMMLGRLLDLAGPHTRVVLVSDHGFQTDRQRPASASLTESAMLAWHRPSGICVMAGPGIAFTEAKRAFSVFDIAPAILDAFCISAPERARDIAPIEPQLPQPEEESVAYLKQLGYAEIPDLHAQADARRIAEREQFHLAVAWLDARRPHRAIPLLEALVQRQPRVDEYRIALGHAYAGAGRTGDCRRVVDQFLCEYPHSPAATAAAGLLELEARRAASAVAHFQKAEQLGLQSAELFAGIGRAYLRLNRFADAQRAFARAIELDSQHAGAQGGRGLALLGLGEAAAAADACAMAIDLCPGDPMLHYGWGRSLMRLGQWANARAAFAAAIAIDPDHIPALRRLAEVCDRLGDLTAARHYDREAHLAATRRWMQRQSPYTAPPSP